MGGNFSGLQAFGQILYTDHKETGDDYANDFIIFRAGTTSCDDYANHVEKHRKNCETALVNV